LLRQRQRLEKQRTERNEEKWRVTGDRETDGESGDKQEVVALR